MIPKVSRLMGFLRATVLLFFLHKRPLFVKLDGSWLHVLDLLIMEALSMTATGFKQPGNGDFCRFSQSRSSTDTAPFVEMVNNRLSFGFAHFGVEQGGVASFREFFMATSAAQQTKIILAIDLANGEIALAWAGKLWAIGIDTG
jgi:hypothetical protein